MTFKEYMTEVNGIMLHTDRSIYTGKQLEKITEDYHQYKLASDGDLASVSGSASDFYTDLMKLINAHCKKGLSKPDLVKKMEWVTGSCKMS